MNDRSDQDKESDVLIQIREELAAGFTQAARSEKARPRPQKSRRRAAAVILAVLGISIPSAIAIAEITSPDPDSAPAPLSERPIEGEDAPSDLTIDYAKDGTVRVNGKVVECPASDALIEKIGTDPCEGGAPAPAPLSEKAP